MIWLQNRLLLIVQKLPGTKYTYGPTFPPTLFVVVSPCLAKNSNNKIREANPPNHIPPRDFVSARIDFEAHQENNGISKWYPFQDTTQRLQRKLGNLNSSLGRKHKQPSEPSLLQLRASESRHSFICLSSNTNVLCWGQAYLVIITQPHTQTMAPLVPKSPGFLSGGCPGFSILGEVTRFLWFFLIPCNTSLPRKTLRQPTGSHGELNPYIPKTLRKR